MKIKDVIFGHTRADRKLRKWVYGIEEWPQVPTRAKVVRGIITGSFLVLFALWMFSYGFFTGTGTLPFVPPVQSVIPPDMNLDTTAQEAEQVVTDGAIDVPDYGEENNCVEMAFLAARQFWWEGLQGTVVRIDFTDGSGHMIVGIPTIDEGWKFYDPTGSAWIYPHTGGYLMNKQITGVYYLYDFVWEPVEEVAE